MEYDSILKTQSDAIRKLEAQVGYLAESVRNRDAGELPSTTETNPRDLAHVITTRSGLNYKEPTYPSTTTDIKTSAAKNDENTSAPIATK